MRSRYFGYVGERNSRTFCHAEGSMVNEMHSCLNESSSLCRTSPGLARIGNQYNAVLIGTSTNTGPFLEAVFS